MRRIVGPARELDVSDILDAVRVPTLAIPAVDDRVPIENARELVRRVSDAGLVELPGDAHIPWLADWQRTGQEIERFLTARRPVVR